MTMLIPQQTVTELEKLLETARKDERQQGEQERKEKGELRSKFLRTQPYIYEMKIANSDSFISISIDVEIKEKLWIGRKINREAYAKFIFINPHPLEILSDDELNKTVGMTYYLTIDGIIHHTGGGTLILKTPQLCSPGEWEQIKRGNIATKFMRGE